MLSFFIFLFPNRSIEFLDDSDDDDDNDLTNQDAVLAGKIRSNHREAATAAATNRRIRFQTESLAGLAEYAAEKRSAKREARLRRLFRGLAQYATGPAGTEVVYDAQDDIRNACFHGIRTGLPAEQYAACRVLEVTSVVLGGDQDEWCERLDRQLRAVVQTIQRATPVRVAALRALSMAVFIGSSDTMTTENLMDFCELVAAPEFRNEITPMALRATAWDCWALLATTVSEFDLAGQSDVQVGRGLAVLNQLQGCLEEATDMDLRAAAGTCLALIHESRLSLGISEEEGNVTARRFAEGTWEGSQWEETMDMVKQRVAELSHESGYHLSKKAKKEQRATFREFMATIVDHEQPEFVVNFRNGSVTLHSWREIVQLNFVRHCLQVGFQIQLVTNVTLQMIFGVNGQALHEYTGSMSQIDKRLTLSKTSEAAKLGTEKRVKDRRKRDNIKNDFILNE